MTVISPKRLALLRAQLNAARVSALETRKSMAGIPAANGHEILPFLDTCAREMEETAQLIRSAADSVAIQSAPGCSG